jgi:hypothetical protein
MTVFTPDFAAVDAGFPMYDKGMYRVKVTGRKSTVYERESNTSPGTMEPKSRIRYTLEMFGRHNGDDVVTTDENGKEIRGKPVQAMDVYLHSEGAWSMAKLFVMAGLGFAKNEENEFNEFFQANKDEFYFSGDPGDSEEELESNTGSAWGLLVDRLVDVYLVKVEEEYQGVKRENQRMSAWQPVGEKVEL